MRLATWNFDRKLVVLSDLDQDKSPNMVYLNCCPFWVRIYDLPLNLRVKRVAQTIADTIPQFMEWNKNEENRLGHFVRVWNLMDVIKSLRRGTQLKQWTLLRNLIERHKFLSWNWCGLGSPWAIWSLWRLLSDEGLDLVFFMETKKKVTELNGLR